MSMTLEQAIRILHPSRTSLGFIVGSTQEAFKLIDKAKLLACEVMQREVEMGKGCEYCRDDSPLPAEGEPHDFRIRGDALLYFDPAFGWEGTLISYCPACGKHLNDGKVDGDG